MQPIELTLSELDSVSGGHIRDNLTFSRETGLSHETTYAAGIASAIFFTGVLLVPGIGTVVALTAFSASLTSSAIAISAGT